MPFTLAQKRCENFGTCLSAGDDAGMAYANAEIFKNFRIGKQNLMMNNCEAVRKQIDAITQHMTVPLVQGTIRYAHVQDKQGTKTEKAQAEGAVFAAAVLPLVHHCSAADADIIYSNMKVGNNGMANFKAVKEAFERQYECLGITCDHVGGLVDDVNGGFWEGAEPCGHIKAQNTIATSAPQGGTVSTTSATSNNNRSAPADDGPNVGLAVGLTIGIVAGLIIIALLISRKNQKEFDGAANAEMA